jgi:hypothetical protein
LHREGRRRLRFQTPATPRHPRPTAPKKEKKIDGRTGRPIDRTDDEPSPDSQIHRQQQKFFFFSIFIISSFLYIYLSFLLSYTGYILNYAVRRRTASQPVEGNKTSKWFLLAAVRLLLDAHNLFINEGRENVGG